MVSYNDGSMKTLILISLGFVVSTSAFAGEVRTKDQPKKCGGYHGGSYHFKCESENKNLVDREQGWKNPFKGFTEKSAKPKKQGEMPHSR